MTTKNDREDWTIQQHFLALISGDAFQVMKYTMTPGFVNGTPSNIICYRPDEQSPVLFPVFASVSYFSDVTDMQLRRFNTEIKNG